MRTRLPALPAPIRRGEPAAPEDGQADKAPAAASRERLRADEVIPAEPSFEDVLAEWGQCRACGGPDDHAEQCVHAGFVLPTHDTTATPARRP